jgi:cyclopropane-fatty-acyl-phospholipid synthase
MNTTTAPPPPASRCPARPRPPPAHVCNCCSTCATAALTLQLPDGSVQRFGRRAGPLASAVLHLHNWNGVRAALKSGDIGFAESYIAGDWTRRTYRAAALLIANRQALDDVIYGSWAGRLLYRSSTCSTATAANSRKNIHAHYDLGNAFYGSGWTRR